MTESEWFASENPVAMLACVPKKDRKLRLFACAWARWQLGCWVGPNRHQNRGRVERTLGLLGTAISVRFNVVSRGAQHVVNRLTRQPTNSWTAAAEDARATARHTLAVGERFADGLATDEECAAAYHAAAAGAAGWMSYDVGVSYESGLASAAVAWPSTIAGIIFSLDPYLASEPGRRMLTRDRARQARLLREIFRNPFRNATVKENWLQADGGAVSELAEEIYRSQRFCDLLKLAEVLRRAGCDDSELLRHCASRGPHFRGCWALDTISRRV